jgi:hypothetical protein
VLLGISVFELVFIFHDIYSTPPCMLLSCSSWHLPHLKSSGYDFHRTSSALCFLVLVRCLRRLLSVLKLTTVPSDRVHSGHLNSLRGTLELSSSPRATWDAFYLESAHSIPSATHKPPCIPPSGTSQRSPWLKLPARNIQTR